MTSLSTFAAKTLEPGKRLHVTIRGSSMYPYLRDGDTIEIEKTDQFRRGDIVVFEMNGALVAHRIIEISADSILAKGDAVRNPERIKTDAIAGKAIALVRNAQTILLNSFRARLYYRFLPISSLCLRALLKYTP